MQYLARLENVMCRDCGKRAASDVHHCKRLSDRPDLKYDEANLMPLCGECHDRRTARGE